MIKGFIFDIDNTIYCRKEHTVPKSTFNALNELKKKGYKIAVCTAREKDKLRTVPHELLKLADMVIVGLGALAYKDYYLYWSNLIKEEDLEKYADYLNSHNITYSYTEESGKTYYWGSVDEKRIVRILDWSARLPKMKKLTKDLKVVNFEIYNYSEEDYDYLYSINENVTPIKWTENAFFCAEGINKAEGIDLFCDAYGFNKDEIVAFGDGDFDIPMIKAAGVGVAMKESSDETKANADYVCEKSMVNGGVYEALVKLGYIERETPDIKIFFFDIDHTTFDHSIKDARQSTITALKKLKEKGIKLCFATSRSPEELFNAPKKLSELMDGIVCCAGAYTMYKDEVVTRVIDDDLASAIKYMDENDITYRYVLENGKGYLNRHDKSKEDIFMRLYDMIPPVKKYEGEKIVHLLYYTEDKEQKLKMHSILSNSSHINFTLSNEVMAPETDKSIDMIRLAKRLGYSEENVGAFGDSFNDVDMLYRAKLGICMGNGRDVAKLAANYITDDISEEGLYNSLIKYGYIKE